MEYWLDDSLTLTQPPAPLHGANSNMDIGLDTSSYEMLSQNLLSHSPQFWPADKRAREGHVDVKTEQKCDAAPLSSSLSPTDSKLREQGLVSRIDISFLTQMPNSLPASKQQAVSDKVKDKLRRLEKHSVPADKLQLIEQYLFRNGGVWKKKPHHLQLEVTPADPSSHDHNATTLSFNFMFLFRNGRDAKVPITATELHAEHIGNRDCTVQRARCKHVSTMSECDQDCPSCDNNDCDEATALVDTKTKQLWSFKEGKISKRKKLECYVVYRLEHIEERLYLYSSFPIASVQAKLDKKEVVAEVIQLSSAVRASPNPSKPLPSPASITSTAPPSGRTPSGSSTFSLASPTNSLPSRPRRTKRRSSSLWTSPCSHPEAIPPSAADLMSPDESNPFMSPTSRNSSSYSHTKRRRSIYEFAHPAGSPVTRPREELRSDVLRLPSPALSAPRSRCHSDWSFTALPPQQQVPPSGRRYLTDVDPAVKPDPTQFHALPSHSLADMPAFSMTSHQHYSNPPPARITSLIRSWDKDTSSAIEHVDSMLR